MRISVTIIGHNEVDHLRELLPELQWASEIVYVDCESMTNLWRWQKIMAVRFFLDQIITT